MELKWWIGNADADPLETSLVREVPLNQTVSHGTLNPDHLIPTFASLFKRLAPERCKEWGSQPAADTQDEMLVELFEELEKLAPEGYYFGALEGDGSDFGFWRCHDDN